MKTVLLVIAALLLVFVGVVAYFRFFVTPADKHGMVWQETEQTERIDNREERSS